jgi:hypothetical protein
MKAYILRDMPDHLWRFVRSQAASQGQTVREYLISLITEIEERTTGNRD